MSQFNRAVMLFNLRQLFAVHSATKTACLGLALCTELLTFSVRSVHGLQYGHRKAEEDMITSAESAVIMRRSLAPTVCISETTLANVDEITESYTAPRRDFD